MSETTGTSTSLGGIRRDNSGEDVLIGCDVGKTRCRVQVATGNATDGFEVLGNEVGEGAPGLAADLDATERQLVLALDRLGVELTGRAGAIAVGAAGAQAHPEAAAELADRLARRQHTVVGVTTDAVTAHLGALGAIAGTALIAGTGAVAYHLDPAGELKIADGWGPVIGDVGGGFWFGSHGLQAALAGADGRGPRTSLTDAAASFSPTGELRGLPRILGEGYSRAVAAFAQTVLEHAAAGDGQALRIRAEAVAALTATAGAVTGPEEPVAVVGGLAGNPQFAAALERSLAAAGLAVRPPLGTGLTGALDLAAHLAAGRELPHARQTQLGARVTAHP